MLNNYETIFDSIPIVLRKIKQEIQDHLSRLSLDHLKTILDITTYLSEQESEAATQEIREIPNIMELLQTAESQVSAGHLIDWEEGEDNL
ncbi:hypothetical protein CWATWH0402_3249 [Crocosphaera watsonii WH 0402]|uniref:Uncharacterized protein n=1 Tax=Crocosphaera watsonii WH 0402 TaxID=1284629 RepID=T2JX06_CROWT|nr:hypothetical protein [Crocosphaera watsonii]CCQ69604.1 hypothetical protein CWATWH0402_3249 [Crocosphaera watsonii WH 0402]